jgi:uncharacterized membrane protein YbhN (UPF0104 family)
MRRKHAMVGPLPDEQQQAEETIRTGGADPLAREETVQRNALWHADSRRLRNGLIGLAIFCGLVVALIISVPGLHSAARRIEHANGAWIALAVILELLSCLSYVVLFERIFARLRTRVGTLLSLSELAMNAVVSAGGIGGFALGAWILRSAGAPLRRVAERSVVLFLLTSAVNVSMVAILGILMGIGVLPGSTNPLLTLLPAGAAIAAIAGTLALAAWARRLLGRSNRGAGRVTVTLCAISEGVADSLALIREPDWRVFGAVGYWLCDNLVLLVCFYAYGVHPQLGVIALGYLVGMLANALPIPGGVGAVEGGLVGMLLAFGLHPASLVVAAVLSYRAIALWVPSLIGTAAFWELRSELGSDVLRPAGSTSS